MTSASVSTGFHTMRTGRSARRVERGRDRLRLLGDLLERLLAVERLAAGEEPDLGGRGAVSSSFAVLAVVVGVCWP